MNQNKERVNWLDFMWIIVLSLIISNLEGITCDRKDQNRKSPKSPTGLRIFNKGTGIQNHLISTVKWMLVYHIRQHHPKPEQKAADVGKCGIGCVLMSNIQNWKEFLQEAMFLCHHSLPTEQLFSTNLWIVRNMIVCVKILILL